MITRIWQAWTTPDNADTYEILLTKTIFPVIRAKQIDGLTTMELLRRDTHDETEFVVIFRFADLASIRQMAGPDAEAAFVPDAARKVLSRFEDRARHFDSRFTSDAEKEMEHAG
jgi:heme-degrading monooxygenase HmoA